MVTVWTRDIPAEVRINVYKHLFHNMRILVHNRSDRDDDQEDHQDMEGSNCFHESCDSDHNEMSLTPMNLFLTCRMVKSEAEPVFYKEADFEIVGCIELLGNDEDNGGDDEENFSFGSVPDQSILKICKWSEGMHLGSSDHFEHKAKFVLERRFALYDAITGEYGSVCAPAELDRLWINTIVGGFETGDIDDVDSWAEAVGELLTATKGKVIRVVFQWQDVETAKPVPVVADINANVVIYADNEEQFEDVRNKLLLAADALPPGTDTTFAYKENDGRKFLNNEDLLDYGWP